jgi:hypothetical protein
MRYSSSLLSIVLTGTCVLTFLSGCAKAPDQEIAAAKAAFTAATNAEADKYMANNFANLQSAMEKADGEVANQNRKSALSRNYKRALVLLKNVTDLAGQISAEAPAAKEEMRRQVEQSLTLTQTKIKETRAELKKSSRSRDKKEIAKLMADLDQADTALLEATADFKAGIILEAQKKLSDSQRLIKKSSDKLSCGGVDGLM